MLPFPDRAARLPLLGLGISTEHGAIDVPGSVDPLAARRKHPRWMRFLEVGVEVDKGLDRLAQAWAAAGHPTTYHFLDLNLDDPEDFDPAWLAGLRAHQAVLKPAWICGDAGLWHFGPRDRNQMLLLPPILTAPAAQAMAFGVARLREETGAEVLPENPPGTAFSGDLHLIEFFAELALSADTGLVLDCAHLALTQRVCGLPALHALSHLPYDHVVELHIAGGQLRQTDGFDWVEDDHGPQVLPDTWLLAEHIAARAPNLKAIVIECERNPLPRTSPLFRRAEGLLERIPRRRTAAAPARPRPPAPPPFATSPWGQRQAALVARHLGLPAADLDALDPRAFSTDPLRPARLLTALLEEHPVSAALAGLDRARAFLTDPAGLAPSLAAHGVAAHAFGAWLEAAVGPLARVEAALARCRRPPRQGALARGVATFTLPKGGLDAWLALRATLGAEPLQAVVHGARLPSPPLEHTEEERILLRPDAQGGFVPTVEAGPYAALLAFAAALPGPDDAALTAHLHEAGLSPDEAAALLEELRGEGILA